MQSRAMRLILAAVCCIVSGAAAIFLLSFERQIAERRASVHAFDRRVREATEALADLRVAQQAYVAAGQGVAFWTAKVDATMSSVSNTLLTLRQSAPSRASNAALDEAGTTLGQLSTLDQRIRDYLRSGAPLMAADIIFAEGDETAADAARRLERARVEANLYLDGFEAARRKQEALALAGSAGLVILIVLALALTPRKAAARMESPSLDQTGAPRDVTPLTMSPDETLPLRRAAWPEPESPGIAHGRRETVHRPRTRQRFSGIAIARRPGGRHAGRQRPRAVDGNDSGRRAPPRGGARVRFADGGAHSGGSAIGEQRSRGRLPHRHPADRAVPAWFGPGRGGRARSLR
jgi:hypothetical protein